MIEILQFIFQSFWHWVGSLVLVCCVGAVFVGGIAALRGKS